MNDNIEVKFIKTIQKIPGNNINWITKIMLEISAPFHTILYAIIIIILFFFNKISSLQIFIVCLSQLIIFCIKNFFKRKRPFQSNNGIKILERMTIDPYSFPSGHTLNAFLLSYILEKNNIINLSIVPYFVGLSRVFLGVHYPSDVIGGFILSKIIIIFMLKNT
jgi:undecaprenyl-diphosphatase